jgi:hypothetical protein
MNAIELADPRRGISFFACPGRPAVIFDHAEVLASGPAEVAIELEAGDGRGSATLELEGAKVALDLTPLAGPLEVAGELTGGAELTLCRALGDVESPGSRSEIACLAIASRPTAAALDSAVIHRSIAIVLADGGVVAVLAARPSDAGGHGEEEVAAAMLEPGGEAAVAEALLSTEYDESGRHRRANLELSREGPPSLRAAGAIICGATLEQTGLRIETAFFRWSLDGRPGIGRYEIVTAA